MQAITDTLERLQPGTGTTFEGMTVFPLFGDSPGEPDYLTLDEALAGKQARVVEVSDAGDVPNLLFENRGDKKVLLVDGDELVGAKQNRIINLTILVPAHTRIEIPVSCVEAGRWSYRSGEFASAERAMFSRARAAKAEQVTVRMRRTGTYDADQHDVWDNIAACSETLSVDSPTGAMADIYETYEQHLDRYREAIKAQDGQVGALFAINGQIRGLEVFDSSRIFRHYLKRLVSSYAVEALVDESASREVPQAAAERFLADVKLARAEKFEALGEGEDLRLSAEALAGGALIAGQRVVHLAAFRLDDKGGSSARRAHRYRHHPVQ